MSEETKPTKIYTFINGRYGSGDLYVAALDERGNPAGGHLSSSKAWAQHDIGFTSPERAQKRYGESYPEGFELIWLEEEELETHEGFKAAYALNQAIEEEQPVAS